MIYASHLAHIEAVLSQLMRFEYPADTTLAYYFRAHPQLGAQDRSFIAETAFSCLRHYTQLTALIAPDTPSPRRLMLATLTRILSISQKEIASTLKESERQWISVLKGRTLPTTLPVQSGLPDWVIERLHIPSEELIALGKGLMRTAPLDLRVNAYKAKRDEVLTCLRTEGIEAVATPFSPIGIRLTTKLAINQHPLFKQGIIEVQDEGSQLLGLITGARRGEMVVDFCAGAGGKTLLIGAQMASTGRLYAFDVSEKRLSHFKPRLTRSGLSNVHPQRIAHENDTKIKRLMGKIDRVLVDAPCSGLGTLRRNPDLKFRQNAQSISELTAKQMAILNSASRLLKPGGYLFYATCSILPEENQHIIDTFLASHAHFHLKPMAPLLAELRIVLDTGDYLELKPHQHNTDGFFAAALQRLD